ncbi:MAG: dihydrolipoyllysine-residue succinyltransferase [Desulfuromonas sp.]|uniref:dihydrolipoyllysine-residue succinyltransferase n=1 Tax=Desulfuromonas sp. TaxID=892 RepID=UPI000CBC26DD|nr:dihydrolipoyllysine-residue succinyltransferase [Desulfuromonas sp.]PLX83874.1 MAG: dihydrolipoyllysine-residue succinyltransferase [Desulfuromonas sp.]
MEIKVPQIGESVFEATLAKWHKKDGETVAKDELLCELETDKITLELHAEIGGVLAVGAAEGDTVKVGSPIGTIREEAGSGESAVQEAKEEAAPKAAPSEAPAAKPSGESPRGEKKESPAAQAKPAAPEPKGRITRQPMSPIRQKIAERLVAGQQQAALLTTFNEADMTRVKELRRKHQGHFREKHGVGLGLMSFFVKACVEALKEFPEVNARIEGTDIVYQHFYHIGIAVGSEKGLVVPVLRDAERLHFSEIEKKIGEFVEKVQTHRIGLEDLQGGTFTISNGGVYGSLLSTPLLNPPQCGVLGMHAIQERPVARDGQVVIRPMMNLALSYDHRLVDGRQAVGFLRKVKDCVEEPEEMLLEL